MMLQAVRFLLFIHLINIVLILMWKTKEGWSVSFRTLDHLSLSPWR